MTHPVAAPPALPEDVAAPPDRLARSEVWLIRHGESEGNSGGRLQGQADFPLSALGARQARSLAERLRGERFAALYTSDLGRARATAEALGNVLGLVPGVDAGLREIDIGAWSGLTAEEIDARFPEEWALWQHRRDPAHRRGGGESYIDLQCRIVPVVERLARRHAGERILVVSHGGSINAYLCHLLGLPLDAMWRLTQENSAISRVLPFVNPNRDASIAPGRLICCNDASHLDLLEPGMRDRPRPGERPPRRLLEPADGRVLHGAGQSSDALADYTAAVPGTPPAFMMTYVGLKGDVKAWGARLKTELAKYDWPLIPQVGLSMTRDGHPEDRYEDQVAAGAYDAHIEDFCAVLKDLGRPAFVRIGYEFNGHWNGYRAESFVQAWKRIAAAIHRHGLDRVALVWCYAPEGNDKDFASFYPGDEHVDWWSIDLFSPSHFTAPDTVAFMDAARRAGYPVLIGESTPRHVGVLEGATSWEKWFVPLIGFLQRWPHTKGLSYIAWDWSKYPQWQDWGDGRPWKNEVVLERWRALLREPRWIHGGSAEWPG